LVENLSIICTICWKILFF